MGLTRSIGARDQQAQETHWLVGKMMVGVGGFGEEVTRGAAWGGGEAKPRATRVRSRVRRGGELEHEGFPCFGL